MVNLFQGKTKFFRWTSSQRGLFFSDFKNIVCLHYNLFVTFWVIQETKSFYQNERL